MFQTFLQNMIIEGDANIELMNGNPFVSNYIWDESEEFLFVAGKKEFREPVGKHFN